MCLENTGGGSFVRTHGGLLLWRVVPQIAQLIVAVGSGIIQLRLSRFFDCIQRIQLSALLRRSISYPCDSFVVPLLCCSFILVALSPVISSVFT